MSVNDHNNRIAFLAKPSKEYQMKVSHLASSLALAMAVLSPVVSMAADDNSSATKPEMAPHSHTQEKGYGAPAKKKATENKSAPEQTENAEKSAKPNAANDRSKHYHPRDGK
ncbi:MAG: hypothetical protein ACKO0Z_03890 [Betaproteobacteria bacterium]